MPPSDLSEVQKQLDALAEKGNQLMDQEKFREAEQVFRVALKLIPQPREGSASMIWFLVAIGDAQWFMRDHVGGMDTWRDVLLYGGLGNPFAHLRRGQVLYELGDESEAGSELLRALLLGGEDVFAREAIDYWAFITSIADAPENYPGWIGWPGIDKDSPVYDWLMDPSAYKLQTKLDYSIKSLRLTN